MKQWLRSSVLLAIPVVAWACSGDPTDVSDGVPSAIIASPQRVFVVQGASEAVSVRLIDDRGNPVPTTFTLTAPASAAFTVTEDTTQKLVYDAAGVLVRPRSTTSARYIVAASGFAKDSFKVESTDGKSIYVVVSSYPTTLPATFSTNTPALGAAVTVTAPAGTFFRPTTTATVPGGTVTILTRAADSNSVTLRVSPGSNGPISFTNIGIRSDPTLSFTAPTVGNITLAAVTAYSGTLSTSSPSAGQVVTLTGASGFKVAPNATVSIGGSQATTITVSADSNVLSFVAPTGATGAILITGTVAGGSVLGLLPTGLTLTAANGAIPPVVGTGAFATAPTITITKGKAVGVVSGAPFTFANTGALAGTTSQLFKFTTTTANQVIKFDVWASGGADLGLYFYKSDFTLLGTSAALSVDANGSGAGNAESGSVTFAAAGTYYISVVTFDPDPIAYGVTVTPQ